MSLRFITNTVWRDCAKIATNGLTIDSGSVHNLLGGPVYTGMQWTFDSQADHVIYQRNDDYSLIADTCVIAGMEGLTDTSGYKLAYLDESSGWVDISPNETGGDAWDMTTDAAVLIGPQADSFCLTFTEITDAAAYRFQIVDDPPTVTTGEFQKIYFSNSLSFDVARIVKATLTPTKETVVLNRVAYVCDYKAQILFENITRSDLDNFKAQHKPFEQPFFIYDSAEQYLPGKLWHVIMPEFNTDAQFDDNYQVTMTLYRLKHYADYVE